MIMEPVSSVSFLQQLLEHFEFGVVLEKPISMIVEQAEKFLTFPFHNAIVELKKKHPGWIGILDEIEDWWNDKGLISVLSTQRNIPEVARDVAALFEQRTHGHHKAEFSAEIFEKVLTQLEAETCKHDLKEAVLRRVEAHVQTDRRVNELFVVVEDLRQQQVFYQTNDTAVAELVAETKRLRKDAYTTPLNQIKQHLIDNELSAAFSEIKHLIEKAELEGIKDQDIACRIHVLAGVCYLRIQDNTTARAHFNEALLAVPNDPKALANLAQLDYAESKAANGLERLSAVVNNTDSPPDFVLGVYLLCLGDSSNDQEFHNLQTRHETLISTSAVCIAAVGSFHYVRQQHSDAQKRFEQAIALAEKDVNFRLLHLNSLLRPIMLRLRGVPLTEIEKSLAAHQEELTDLVDWADVAVSLSRQGTDRVLHSRSLEMRATIQMLRGKTKEALDDCSRSEDYLPKRLETQRVKASIYLAMDKYEEVLEILRLRTDLQPPDKRTVGYAYYRLDDFESACNWFEKTTPEISANPHTLAYIQSLFLAGRRKQLIQIAAQLRYSNFHEVNALKMEAHCLIREERWEDAMEVLKLLSKEEPDVIDHRLNILAMNMNLADKTAALAARRDVIEHLKSDDRLARSAFLNLEQGLMYLGWLKEQ